MSTTVAASLAPGVAVDVDTFADITPQPVESVQFDSGFVVVTFTATLPPAAIRAVIRRISLPPAAEAAISDLEGRVTALENRPATA